MNEVDFKSLTNVLQRIGRDSQSRGILNRFSILKLFPPEDIDRINQMFADWDRLHDQDTGKGELDIAVAAQDQEKVFELLKGMIPENREFLQLAAKRFLSLVSKH